MSHQKRIRWESERRIINALYEGDRSFTSLIKLTDLSKPVLSQRLKELKKEGKIGIVPETATRRFLYHLIQENLDTADEIFIKMYMVSKVFVSSLTKLAKDPSISDKEYDAMFENAISILITIKMQSYRLASPDVWKAWLKSTFGVEFVKNLSELLPDSRRTLPTVKSLHPKHLAVLKAKDRKELEKRLLEFYDHIIKQLPPPKQEPRKL